MDKVSVSCIWTIKENGKVVARNKNVFTDFGLTALASAPSGAYIPPIYLSIDTNATQNNFITNAGDGFVYVLGPVHIAGDTQLVLSPGQANQEIVTFSAYTVSSPNYYTLVGTAVNTHAVNSYVVRVPLHTDTLSTVISEMQYDSVNNPNMRLPITSFYGNGLGSSTLQWYFTSTMAAGNFMTLGLTDNVLIGSGNLHNHVVLGFTHITGSDVEVDVVLTLTNA